MRGILRCLLIFMTMCTLCAEDTTPTEPTHIVLYYSSMCPHSRKVLNYLKSIDKTVPMKNVVNNPEAKKELLENGGELMVPCLMVDGVAIYNDEKIIEWLKTHQKELINPSPK